MAMDDYFLKHVEDNGLACHIKRNLNLAILSPSVQTKDIKKVAMETFKSSDLETQMKNALYKEYMRLQLSDASLYVIQNREIFSEFEHLLKEPLDFIDEVQTKWCVRLKQAVNGMSAQLGMPLSKQRTVTEQDHFLKCWGSLGAMNADTHDFRPVFTAKDIFEVLMGISNPNLTEKAAQEIERWKLLPLNLFVTSLHDLRVRFQQLDPKLVQLDSAAISDELAEDAILLQTSKVQKTGLFAAARYLCRLGCPTGSRFDLWRMALCIDFEDGKHALNFEELKSMAVKYNMLFDFIMLQDVRSTVANDDDYFVFEDLLYQILFCFLRDTSVLEIASYSPVKPFTARTKGRIGTPVQELVYPPCGVVPVHGFAYYIAPLCYTQENGIQLYALFNGMYKRYFYQLHTLSSQPNGLLSLCCLFESTLQQRNPTLILHLKSVNLEPLKLAYKWIVYAFAGYLDPDQVLLLWDRIVGFDSLEIVPVLAAAIFHFRASSLLQVSSLGEAEGVLGNLHTLKVLPLLQHMLFLD